MTAPQVAVNLERQQARAGYVGLGLVRNDGVAALIAVETRPVSAGSVARAAGAVLFVVMVKIIDPKLSATSKGYEEKQKEYLEELEKKLCGPTLLLLWNPSPPLYTWFGEVAVGLLGSYANGSFSVPAGEPPKPCGVV